MMSQEYIYRVYDYNRPLSIPRLTYNKYKNHYQEHKCRCDANIN